MRYMGFVDAYPTPPGPDGGVDVDSTGAVAQVKAELAPTGRPRIQQLARLATIWQPTTSLSERRRRPVRALTQFEGG